MKTDMMPGASSIQEENTKDIFILNYTIPVISGNCNPALAMTCAVTEGTPPRCFSYLKTPLASQVPVTDASRTFTIFHGGVRTIPVHARFYSAKNGKKQTIF